MENKRKNKETISLPGQINNDLTFGDKKITHDKIISVFSSTLEYLFFKHAKKTKGRVENNVKYKNLIWSLFDVIFDKKVKKVIYKGE